MEIRQPYGRDDVSHVLDVITVRNLHQVAIAAGSHLFPFRTEKLSPLAPMVLQCNVFSCGALGIDDIPGAFLVFGGGWGCLFVCWLVGRFLFIINRLAFR